MFIFKQGGSTEIDDLYWKTEQKCRKYTLQIGLYVLVHTSEFGVSLLFTIISIIYGNYNPENWLLYFKLTYPFDERKSVFNWFAAWFIEANLSFAYSICLTSAASYFVSCALYIIAMCDHFTLLMHSIDRQNNLQQTVKNRIQIKRMLAKSIELHVRLIE